MKIAAGCFGCLTFIFLALTLSWGIIWSSVVTTAPELAMEVGPAAAYVNYLNGTCCCLSATLMIVFLIVGSMGKKEEQYE
jgi:hypothetical protein